MSKHTIPLRELATARSGDKGNRLNIGLICRDPSYYPEIARQVTAARVMDLFAARRPKAVTRYDLPKLVAFNFVLDEVLEGGVNASLGLDGHGKALSFLLLTLELRIEAMPRKIQKNEPITGGKHEANFNRGHDSRIGADLPG